MSAEVPAPPSRAAIRQTWGERLQRFADSGLSVAAFCRTEGVPVQTFYYWKRRLTRHGPVANSEAPTLIPVRLAPQPAPVELLLPTGACLRLPPGCDLAWVRRLVETLGGPPC